MAYIAEDIRELSRIVNSGGPAYLKTTYLLLNDIDMQPAIIRSAA